MSTSWNPSRWSGLTPSRCFGRVNSEARKPKIPGFPASESMTDSSLRPSGLGSSPSTSSGPFIRVKGREPRRIGRATFQGAFTLADVLAALLFMAILIPVTMHGVSVASRAGILGQRKATAMRIAERVLDEQILSGQMATATPYGSIVEGDTNYAWTMKSDPWPEDITIMM